MKKFFTLGGIALGLFLFVAGSVVGTFIYLHLPAVVGASVIDYRDLVPFVKGNRWWYLVGFVASIPPGCLIVQRVRIALHPPRT